MQVILQERNVDVAYVFLSELLSLPTVESMQELLQRKLVHLLPAGDCAPAPAYTPLEDV